MIIHKVDRHLVRALREQVKAQKELIAALEEYIKILKDVNKERFLNG